MIDALEPSLLWFTSATVCLTGGLFGKRKKKKNAKQVVQTGRLIKLAVIINTHAFDIIIVALRK